MSQNCSNFARNLELLYPMAQTGNLYTVSQQHSVKEAVITFALTPKLTNSSEYEHLLEEGASLYGRYHKFEPIVVQEINVDARLNQTEVKGIREHGFKLIRFDGGKTTNIIQAIPQPTQTLLTFNTVNYVRWSDYLQECMTDAKAISTINQNLLMASLGVMFVDEFYFKEHDKYNPEEIFNLNSSNLPKSIFDSDFTDYNLSNHKTNSGFDYIENLSIQVCNDMENGRKVVRITGNIMSFISPVMFADALNTADILTYLNFGHDQNKNMLKSILSSDALNMIGL